MKYLVTGGAGFIGSNFINYLFDKYPDLPDGKAGCEVINLDKLEIWRILKFMKKIQDINL
jgi:dTDP-glucose 4,6-dehydratase